MLITGSWEQKKTFKLIPVTPDSVFNEGIFDPDSKVLALIGKDKKQSMHMVPKLDDNGDLKVMRVGKRPGGKDYAEERKLVETYYEYYIEDINEIMDLINLVAINADSFDFKSYLNQEQKPVSNLVTV
jgi:hypothetical protein